jgi:NAD(P) transhydrogenase subunit alpha
MGRHIEAAGSGQQAAGSNLVCCPASCQLSVARRLFAAVSLAHLTLARCLLPAVCYQLTLSVPALAAEGVGGEVDPTVYRLAVFILAIFVGYYVVWSVTPALHTPLMSVTNAISSVIVVGALIAVGVSLAMSGSIIAKFFGLLALALASVNIFGGFFVTQRMLGMYKRKGK